MRESVRLGCWAAFWGDTSTAVDQILDGSEVDYLVSDYLSEITMALLARARQRDPEAGFVPDAVRVIAPRLAEIRTRGIKVITNAGALNPVACAQAFRDAAEAAGVTLRVAAIEGDDLMPQLDALRDAGAADMFTGEPLPDTPMTMNAYLGARPIAAALAAGADIVVTGRSVDSSVVLGPLMHEFGWQDTDYDLLSAGTLAGPRRSSAAPSARAATSPTGTPSRAGTTWATRSRSASRTAARSSPSRRTPAAWSHPPRWASRSSTRSATPART